ncbi:unnamed protein product [Porites lobata]|uniref:THD domain-containing protein n=1 Tax=Porites lobata TaxID=104759 RepID=A0ABN8QNM0_9CNID|nr:unnamed protein product [Porites lobata]
MKFVVIIVASVCANLYFCMAANTSGNQNACADSKQPITVNDFAKGSQKGEKGLKGDTGTKGDKGSPCQCSLQNPNKPSAHIEAAKKYYVSYQAGQIIKDWSVSTPYSHLAGGMKYHDGKLTVPTSGRYYMYVQAYYRGKGRIAVHVNNKRVTLVHFPWPGKGDTGTALTAGVFNLKSGDVITFALEYNCTIYMGAHHTYFGAYLI